MIRVEVAGDASAAAAAAADHLAEVVNGAVTTRGTCALAVSGGTTPVRLFEELAKLDVPWSAVHVFQVDERLAPDGHPDRNVTVLRDHLLSHVALPATNLHPMPVGMPSLDAAAARYQRVLEEVCGSPAGLDAVHLGLGRDGHTASLFPGDPATDVTDADVAPTGEHEGRQRLTLTVPALQRARARVWLVTGDDKAPALEALVRGDGGPVARLGGEGAVAFVDSAAASGLDR